MKTFCLRLLMALTILVGYTTLASAKDITVALECEPNGCKVYLNNMYLTDNAPCMVEIPAKMLKKSCMFRFEKEGYESKSVTVMFTPNMLKYGPVVRANLKKTAQPKTSSDPTVSNKQAAQRVDRNNSGSTDMEATILRWYFDSDPRGARIYTRVISNCPNEVKNTNEAYLMTTPYEETKSFGIPGLTYDNSRNVTIEVKVSKRGYEDQVKRFNVRQALDQQEISGFFELVPKESAPSRDNHQE